MNKSLMALICVNYNSSDEVFRFLEKFNNLTYSDEFEILIVDNSTNPNERDILSKRLKQDNATLLIPGKNTGYFGGVRHAFQYIDQVHKCIPKILIVSNIDISFSSNNFLADLLDIDNTQKEAKESNIGIIVPNIYLDNKASVNQNPFMSHRPSLLKILFYKFLFSNFYIYKLYEYLHLIKRRFTYISSSLNNFRSKNLKPKLKLDGRKKIYAPHGSFLVFRTSYFENHGDFNFKSFLFWEEVFLAETCRSKNLDIYLYDNLQIYHSEHITTGQRKTRQMYQYIKSSSNSILDEFFLNKSFR